MYCPYCGSENTEGSAFCRNCGKRLAPNTSEPTPAQEPARDPDRTYIPGQPYDPEPTPTPDETPEEAHARKKRSKKPIAVIAVVLVLLLLAGAAVAVYFIFFNKEKPGYAYLDGKDLYYADPSGKPKMITTLGENCGILLRGKKYLYFNDGEKLYAVDPDGKKDPILICKDVKSDLFAISDDEKYISYVSDGGTLYRFDIRTEDKETVASRVKSFVASRDGKSYYYKNEDGALYYLESAEGDKVRVGSDAASFFASPDFRHIYWINSDASLYESDRTGEKTKLSADAELAGGCFNDGSFYYAKKADGERTLCYYDGTSHTVAKLASSDVTNNYLYYCYYYALFFPEWLDTPFCVFVKSDGDGGSAGAYAALGEKTYRLTDEKLDSFTLSSDGHTVAFIAAAADESDGGNTLYEWSAKRPSEKPARVDEDVYSMVLAGTGGTLYLKDDFGDYNTFGLYSNGRYLSDLSSRGFGSALSQIGTMQSDCYAFFSDYDSDDSTGTLTYYNGKTCKQVAYDVTDFVLLENGSLVYRTDVSSKGVGTLKLYDGSSYRTISEDASKLLNVIGVSTYSSILQIYYLFW